MQPKDNDKHSYLFPNFSKINYAKPNTETVLLNQRIAATKSEQQLPFYHQYSYIYFKPFNQKIIPNNHPNITSEHNSDFHKKTLTYKLTTTIIKDEFEHINPLKLSHIEEIYLEHFKKNKLNRMIYPRLLNESFLSFRYSRYLKLNHLLDTVKTNKNNKEELTRFYFELKTNTLSSKYKKSIEKSEDVKLTNNIKIRKAKTKNNIKSFKIKQMEYSFIQTEVQKQKLNTELNDKTIKTSDKILQNYDKTIIKNFTITGNLPKIIRNNIRPFNSWQPDTDHSQKTLHILKDFLEPLHTKPFFKNELSLYA